MKFRFFIVCGLIMIFLSQICDQPSRQVSRNLMSGRGYILPVRKKLTGEQKKQLSPGAEDLTKYAEFLAQSKTGIFRLLPDLGCEENPLVIKADAKCLRGIPESSFYSFREKEHTPEFLSDIRLENNHLISDGIMAQGILVALGEVSLENITLKSDGLDFLTKYSPHSSAEEAKKQFTEIARGIKVGQYTYRKAFPARENATFALRVIAYRGNIFKTFRGYRFDLLEGDKRIDLILALRVIRKGTDGGVTLLWKELQRKESPRIKFQKQKIGSKAPNKAED